MSAALLVRKAGICSTVQDLGRPGFRAYGVPSSGALDAIALELANVLVGNPPDSAGIEMMYSGITLEALASVRIAVGGAEATITGSGATRTQPAWQSTILERGETLRVGTIRETAAAYIAVEGGLDVPLVLGSASTYLRGALGGWQGRALRVGDVLPLKLDSAAPRAERRYTRAPAFLAPACLRVMPGPQADRFDEASLEVLLSNEYVVSASADRSGLRLEGPLLQHVDGYDTSSEGVASGSIQVPGSGLPVILIGDHPTVGGYPKIATIISADLAAAGRLRIGSHVRFAAVDEHAAARARGQSKLELEAVASSIANVGAAQQ